MTINHDMKILLVDDDKTMRRILEKMMKEIGFSNLIFAEDGLDAVQKLYQHKDAALIISDWNMPRMSGLDLLKAVRRGDEFKHIPVIMATAQGDKTQQQEAADQGSNGHITKPFNKDTLIKGIFTALGEVLEDAAQSEGIRPRIIDDKVVMKIAHIQITDHLTLGVIKHWIEKGEIEPKHFVLETNRMAGWNPVQDALEKGEAAGAFVLAPIAMDLFAYDVPINLVALAHKNGSIMVRSSRFEGDAAQRSALRKFYLDKVISIPHKMSIHNMLAHRYLKGLDLSPGVPDRSHDINVRFEVIPPIQMPGALKDNDNAGGFIVAEPIGSKAIKMELAEKEFLSGEKWDGHPCCVVVFRKEFIENYTDAVYEFVQYLVEAGKYIEDGHEAAAEIAVNFLDPEGKLGLKVPVLQNVLQMQNGIKMYDLYPVLADLDYIQRYMHMQMNIGKLIDVEKFVDLKFIEAVKA